MDAHMMIRPPPMPIDAPPLRPRSRLARLMRAERLSQSAPDATAGRWSWSGVLLPVTLLLIDPWRALHSLPVGLAIIGCTILVGLVVFSKNRKRARSSRLREIDALSGLYNRKRFYFDLTNEIERAKREGKTLVMSCLDVDDLQSINERAGHTASDRVISMVGRGLQESTRPNIDSCYRIGGNEFVVLTRVAVLHSGERVMQRMRLLAERQRTRLTTCGAGLSMGAIELRPKESPEAFLRRADERMLIQKRAA